MRLLSTHNWEMTEFISDDQVPPYAILSHTWEEEEIDFQHWENRKFVDIGQTKGYRKIKQFGERAASNGYDWVWVDTCCIDKKSSAELTEAVNAMFRWYKNAAVCYTYLSDATWCEDTEVMYESLRECRWFTRGWTLQELIAPRNVIFYSSDWQEIANKETLCGLLSSITGIDEHILRGADLADVSVARRMSWASRRKTTRIEDIAYCLLGIFDINLPLIYGEGIKAFRRLQEAIMGTTYDQSLFAWEHVVTYPSGLIDRAQEMGLKSIPWKPPEQREPLLGIFATSPADFDKSSDISPVDHGYAHHINRRRPPSMVNGGALIDLVIFKTIASTAYWEQPAIAQPHKADLAVLLCRAGNTGSQLVGLILHPWGDDYYSRTRELVLVDFFVSHVRFNRWTRTRHVMPERPYQLRNGDILLRRWSSLFRCLGVDRPTTRRGPAWRQKWQDKILRMEEDVKGDEDISFFFEIRRHEGIALTLRRVSKGMKPIGALLIGASPFETTGSTVEEGMKMPNWMPKHGPSFRDPAFSHILQSPSDTWKFEVEDQLCISATVERMPLDDEGGAIDIMDVFIYPYGTIPSVDEHVIYR